MTERKNVLFEDAFTELPMEDKLAIKDYEAAVQQARLALGEEATDEEIAEAAEKAVPAAFESFTKLLDVSETLIHGRM